jgi:acetyl esterase/lipase
MKLSALIICVFCFCSALSAQGPTGIVPDVAPLPEESTAQLQPGEIELTGQVAQMNWARQSFMVMAISYSVPSGKSVAIDPPRQKTISINADSRLHHLNGTQLLPIFALRRGDLVSIIGRDGGSRQPLAARYLQLRAATQTLIAERARAKFQTKLIPNTFKADGAAPEVEGFQLVKYQSPAGDLAAYISNDPGDGSKRPAVLWAHGGFGGIGAATAKQAKVFADVGCAVMIPSWRGENDNPGQFELFNGEVDDALAALDYLAKLPYVDASRLYVAGHSTGGTIALLVAQSTPRLRATFSFGGAPDIANVLQNGGYKNTPFVPTEDETRFRSPMAWTQFLRTPTFYFEGADSFYLRDAKYMDSLAERVGAPFEVFIVEKQDHFSVVPPLLRAVAQKIAADTGVLSNISFTDTEIKEIFKRAIDPNAA